MGLTKIRAGQISNIDYKQSCRVLTASNITLSGGAPAEVDGVSLLANDRVLVIGQTNKAQNGLYRVSVLGTGSDGTWVRSMDGNENGEIEAGMIVMVTEGDVYRDTQWKLITNDPIVLDTTELVFEQNSAFAFGNIYANGTAVLANTVGDAVTFTAGDNISITGNASAKSITFAVSGISLNSISNGTSNVTVVSSGGNVTVGIADSTVATFSASGLDIEGNITGNGAGLSGINVFSNVAISGGNAVVADSISDTLNLVAGTGIVLIGDSSTDTITIATSGSGQSIFATGGDMGLVTQTPIVTEDLGLVTAAVLESYDLGEIVTGGVLYPDLLFIGDIADLFILGGTDGQYLGTSGNGVMQWQTLDSASLSGNLAGNILGNSFSILDLASLTVTGNITGGNVSVGTGTVFLGNIENTNSNGVGNIGSASTYFDTVFAKATSAQYADLAECYVADRDYPSGTVLIFGGLNEVTISDIKGDPRVAGVVSTNPSFIMNSGVKSDHVVAIALMGRVPTLVKGPVHKGDLMVSDRDGRACACSQPGFGTVIGKSLEDFDGDTGIIEIVVGVR